MWIVLKCERALSLSPPCSFITSISIPHSRLLRCDATTAKATDRELHFSLWIPIQLNGIISMDGCLMRIQYSYSVHRTKSTVRESSHWATNVMARARLFAIPLKETKKDSCRYFARTEAHGQWGTAWCWQCLRKGLIRLELIDWLKCEVHSLRNQAEISPMGIFWNRFAFTKEAHQSYRTKTHRFFLFVFLLVYMQKLRRLVLIVSNTSILISACMHAVWFAMRALAPKIAIMQLLEAFFCHRFVAFEMLLYRFHCLPRGQAQFILSVWCCGVDVCCVCVCVLRVFVCSKLFISRILFRWVFLIKVKLKFLPASTTRKTW